MAGFGVGNRRLLLVVVVVCFIACVCEARGSRGGGARFRGGSRYRGGGSYRGGSTSGSSSAGMIVGIIFGTIGGFIALVVITVLCKKHTWDNSSSGSAKYNSGGVVLNTRAATTTTTAAVTPSSRFAANDYSTRYGNDFTTSDNENSAHGGVQPPSYESVVNDTESGFPYSTKPASGLPYSSNPAGYSSSATNSLPYSVNPAEHPSSTISSGNASAPELGSRGEPHDTAGALAPVGWV